MISINATVYNVNRTLNQKQIKLNQKKWGSSNWISYVEISSIKDIQSTDQYLVINTNRNIGMIEIDSLQYLVESSLYLSVYFDQSLNDRFKNSSYDSVSFNMFLKDLKTKNNRDFISEIQISTKEYFYNLTGWLFIVISILI